MQFVPYHLAASAPNIIVDGAATGGTVLTLSHWPKSGTPHALRADTSTEIVFRYLDTPAMHVSADAVSNNHFDEDGLLGIFAIIEPAAAEPHRAMLIDASRAGDFGVFTDRRAARIAFTLGAYADPDRSPLPRTLFEQPHDDLAAGLYRALLGALPGLLANIDEYRDTWAAEDAQLTATERLIDSGLVTIEERPDLDLAVIRAPEDLILPGGGSSMRRQLVDCHDYALHNRTACSRLLLVQGAAVEFRYRYESWVQMASRKPAPRVDLSALAAAFSLEEGQEGTWIFDGVARITPRLHLEGRETSMIEPDAIVRRIEDQLRAGPPAWSPYDES